MPSDSAISLGIDLKDIKSLELARNKLEQLGKDAGLSARDIKYLSQELQNLERVAASSAVSSPFSSLSVETLKAKSDLENLGRVARETNLAISKSLGDSLFVDQIRDGKAFLSIESKINSELENQVAIVSKLASYDIGTSESVGAAKNLKLLKEETAVLAKKLLLQEKLYGTRMGPAESSLALTEENFASIERYSAELKKMGATGKATASDLDFLQKELAQIYNQMALGDSSDFTSRIAFVKNEMDMIERANSKALRSAKLLAIARKQVFVKGKQAEYAAETERVALADSKAEKSAKLLAVANKAKAASWADARQRAYAEETERVALADSKAEKSAKLLALANKAKAASWADARQRAYAEETERVALADSKAEKSARLLTIANQAKAASWADARQRAYAEETERVALADAKAEKSARLLTIANQAKAASWADARQRAYAEETERVALADAKAAKSAKLLAIANQAKAASWVKQMTANQAITKSAEKATNSTKRLTVAQQLQHGAVRGLAGGLGKLWLSYGQGAIAIGTMGAAYAATRGFIELSKQMIKVGSDFEYTTRYIYELNTATVEASGGIDSMRDRILSLGGVFQTANELAGGLQELVRACVDIESAMDALPAVANLATVGIIDVAEATKLTVTAFNAFDDGSRTMTDVANIIAKTANSSATSIQELGTALSYTTELSKIAGMSLEEVSASLAVMANIGIKGSKSGTALRTSIVRLMTPTSKLRGYLRDLNVEFSAFTVEGKMKNFGVMMSELATSMKDMSAGTKSALFKEMFGLRAMKGGVALLEDFISKMDGSISSYDGFLEAISNSNGELARMMTGLEDTVKGQGLLIKKAWNDALVTGFMDSTNEGLIGALGELRTILESAEFKSGVTEFATNMSDAAVAVGSFLAANPEKVTQFFNTVLVAAGSVYTAIEKFVQAMNTLVALRDAMYGQTSFGEFFDMDKEQQLNYSVTVDDRKMRKQLEELKKELQQESRDSMSFLEYLGIDLAATDIELESELAQIDADIAKLSGRIANEADKIKEGSGAVAEEYKEKYLTSVKVIEAGSKEVEAALLRGAEEAKRANMRLSGDKVVAAELYFKSLAKQIKRENSLLSAQQSANLINKKQYTDSSLALSKNLHDAEMSMLQVKLDDLKLQNQFASDTSGKTLEEIGAVKRKMKELKDERKIKLEIDAIEAQATLRELADKIRDIKEEAASSIQGIMREGMTPMDSRKDQLSEIDDLKTKAAEYGRLASEIDQSTIEGKAEANRLLNEQIRLLGQAKTAVSGLGTSAIETDKGILAMAKAEAEAAKVALQDRNIEQNRERYKDASAFLKSLTKDTDSLKGAKDRLLESERALSLHNTSQKREAYKAASENYALVKSLDAAGVATDKLSVARLKLAYAEKSMDFKGRDRTEELAQSRKLLEAEQKLYRVGEQMGTDPSKRTIAAYKEAYKEYEKLYNNSKKGIMESITAEEARKQKMEEVQSVADAIVKAQLSLAGESEQSLARVNEAQGDLNKTTGAYVGKWDPITEKVLASERVIIPSIDRIKAAQSGLAGGLTVKDGAVTNIAENEKYASAIDKANKKVSNLAETEKDRADQTIKNSKLIKDAISGEYSNVAIQELPKIKTSLELEDDAVNNLLSQVNRDISSSLVDTDSVKIKLSGMFDEAKTAADDYYLALVANSDMVIDFGTTAVEQLERVIEAQTELNRVTDLYKPVAPTTSTLEGRAVGGPVSANTPYVVGELGPELFVPASSGSIIPNDKMGSGESTTNLSIELGGQKLPTLVGATKSSVDSFVSELERTQRLSS